MNKTLINHYHTLHQIPELDFNLEKTSTYISNVLKRMNCIIINPITSAIIAYFDFNQESTIAFKCDMDALPIRENTNHPFSSLHKNTMHACGHDGHMAILLTLAKYINERQNEISNNILLIFEPAEETSGGAKLIINSDVYQKINPKYIFALHLWPKLPKGKILSKAGPIMAKSNEIRIEIKGIENHIIDSELATNSLYSGVKLIDNFYHSLANFPNSILRFNIFKSGYATNVASASTLIQGSIRSKELVEYHQLIKQLELIIADLKQNFQVKIDFDINEGYLGVYNPPNLFHTVKSYYPIEELKEGYFASDDFSYYQERTPGLYAMLGVGDTPPLHNSRFCFDEAVLNTGLEYFISLLNIK